MNKSGIKTLLAILSLALCGFAAIEPASPLSQPIETVRVVGLLVEIKPSIEDALLPQFIPPREMRLLRLRGDTQKHLCFQLVFRDEAGCDHVRKFVDQIVQVDGYVFRDVFGNAMILPIDIRKPR